MNKDEAKKVWLGILDEHMTTSKSGLDLSTCVEQLERIKFTYGGEMRKSTAAGRLDKFYEYGLMHFPSLIRIYEKKHALLTADELANGDSKVAEEIAKNGFADNQCGLCGRISSSKWAFIKTHTRVRLSPDEQKKIQKNKATTVCRDRSSCRKKQEKKRAYLGKHKVVTT